MAPRMGDSPDRLATRPSCLFGLMGVWPSRCCVALLGSPPLLRVGDGHTRPPYPSLRSWHYSPLGRPSFLRAARCLPLLAHGPSSAWTVIVYPFLNGRERLPSRYCGVQRDSRQQCGADTPYNF